MTFTWKNLTLAAAFLTSASAVAAQAGWLVTIAGARGTAVSADPLLDRLWDRAQRSPP